MLIINNRFLSLYDYNFLEVIENMNGEVIFFFKEQMLQESRNECDVRLEDVRAVDS